jgi:hypothetical protein
MLTEGRGGVGKTYFFEVMSEVKKDSEDVFAGIGI